MGDHGPSEERGRRIVQQVSETITIGESLVGRGVDGEELSLFFEQNVTGDGRSAFAQAQNATYVQHAFCGAVPRGEETTARACELIVAALNRDGAIWGDPVPGVSPDATCQSLTDPGEYLHIEVVRATVDPEFWRETVRSGRQANTVDDLVERLSAAIQKKSAHIAPEVRRSWLLALDATCLPAQALPVVVRRFRDRYPGVHGWREIWIAGPSLELTSKLA